jgi:cell division protein ZapD
MTRVPFTGNARVKHNMKMTEADEQGPEQPPETTTPEGTLIFEQPLNERMRTFLRLDFLYGQALYHNEMGSQWGSRAAMGSLIDILAITTRGDVRSDVLKELERQLSLLTDFQSKPGVDVERLKTLMTNLVRLRPPAAARLGVPERHQTPQRHSRRHL